jgi:hypothetical protein
MSKKVAIIGFAPNTMKDASERFLNPNWEIWALNVMNKVFPEAIPHVNRWFQLHQPGLKAMYRDPKQFDFFMTQSHFRLYTLVKWPTLPISEAFPRNEVVSYIRNISQDDILNVFTSTPAWMISLAMYEKFEEIHLYGFDMAGESEYEFERDGMSYLIGLARGAGIKVNIPYKSLLLKNALFYGYDDHVIEKFNLNARINTMSVDLNKMEQEERDHRDARFQLKGEIDGIKKIKKQFMYR